MKRKDCEARDIVLFAPWFVGLLATFFTTAKDLHGLAGCTKRHFQQTLKAGAPHAFWFCPSHSDHRIFNTITAMCIEKALVLPSSLTRLTLLFSSKEKCLRPGFFSQWSQNIVHGRFL